MLRDYVNLPRQVHVLCLGLLINRAGSFVLVFLTIYLSERLGYSKTFAAQSMGLFGLGSMLASLIGGQLADQFGRRIVMLGSLYGGALLLLLLGHVTAPAHLLGTIFLFGLVSESFRPACAAMLGDLTRPEQRPASFGLMYIAINLGFALGPPIGGWLADYSYALLFYGDALTMAVCGVIIMWLLPETRPGVIPDGPHSNDQNQVISVREAARRILSDGPFVAFCLGMLLIALVFMQAFSTLPIHIKSAGYTNEQFGFLIAINGFMIFVCQLPLTHFLQRFNPMSNIVAGGLLIAIGFALYALPATVPLLCCSIVIWTTGEMMQAPFTQTIVTNLAPTELRGRYLGLFGTSYSLALTIGAPIGGYVLDQHGSQALWLGCLVVALLAVAIYMLMYRPVTQRHLAVVHSDAAERRSADGESDSQQVHELSNRD